MFLSNIQTQRRQNEAVSDSLTMTYVCVRVCVCVFKLIPPCFHKLAGLIYITFSLRDNGHTLFPRGGLNPALALNLPR